MPRVSVIIPAFNLCHYLPEAIESVLREEGCACEVVVVDDGSTDDTPQVIRCYLPRVRYHRQENQGLAASLNKGLELASGEYVRFLDADDYLIPDSIRAQVELLDSNPEVALVYGQAYVMDDCGRVFDVRKSAWGHDSPVVVPSADAFRWLLRGCRICKSTVMLRKSAFERVGPFQTDSFPGEDWDEWLRVAAHYDLVYVPSPLAYYRVREGSISAAYTVDSMKASHLHTLRTLFSRADLPYGELEGYAYVSLDRSVAVLAARLRRRGAYLGHMARAMRRQPGLLLEGETWAAIYEGFKLLFPSSLIRAGRDLKRKLLMSRRAHIGQANPPLNPARAGVDPGHRSDPEVVEGP